MMTEYRKKTYVKLDGKEKKKGHSRKAKRLKSIGVSVAFSTDQSVRSIFNSDDSLVDDYWKDPFDRILNGKTPLRQQNLLLKSVRADYNRDSSIENSPLFPHGLRPAASRVVGQVEQKRNRRTSKPLRNKKENAKAANNGKPMASALVRSPPKVFRTDATPLNFEYTSDSLTCSYVNLHTTNKDGSVRACHSVISEEDLATEASRELDFRELCDATSTPLNSVVQNEILDEIGGAYENFYNTVGKRLTTMKPKRLTYCESLQRTALRNRTVQNRKLSYDVKNTKSKDRNGMYPSKGDGNGKSCDSDFWNTSSLMLSSPENKQQVIISALHSKRSHLATTRSPSNVGAISLLSSSNELRGRAMSTGLSGTKKDQENLAIRLMQSCDCVESLNNLEAEAISSSRSLDSSLKEHTNLVMSSSQRSSASINSCDMPHLMMPSENDQENPDLNSYGPLSPNVDQEIENLNCLTAHISIKSDLNERSNETREPEWTSSQKKNVPSESVHTSSLTSSCSSKASMNDGAAIAKEIDDLSLLAATISLRYVDTEGDVIMSPARRVLDKSQSHATDVVVDSSTSTETTTSSITQQREKNQKSMKKIKIHQKSSKRNESDELKSLFVSQRTRRQLKSCHIAIRKLRYRKDNEHFAAPQEQRKKRSERILPLPTEDDVIDSNHSADEDHTSPIRVANQLARSSLILRNNVSDIIDSEISEDGNILSMRKTKSVQRISSIKSTRTEEYKNRSITYNPLVSIFSQPDESGCQETHRSDLQLQCAINEAILCDSQENHDTSVIRIGNELTRPSPILQNNALKKCSEEVSNAVDANMSEGWNTLTAGKTRSKQQTSSIRLRESTRTIGHLCPAEVGQNVTIYDSVGTSNVVESDDLSLRNAVLKKRCFVLLKRVLNNDNKKTNRSDLQSHSRLIDCAINKEFISDLQEGRTTIRNDDSKINNTADVIGSRRTYDQFEILNTLLNSPEPNICKNLKAKSGINYSETSKRQIAFSEEGSVLENGKTQVSEKTRSMSQSSPVRMKELERSNDCLFPAKRNRKTKSTQRSRRPDESSRLSNCLSPASSFKTKPTTKKICKQQSSRKTCRDKTNVVSSMNESSSSAGEKLSWSATYDQEPSTTTMSRSSGTFDSIFNLDRSKIMPTPRNVFTRKTSQFARSHTNSNAIEERSVQNDQLISPNHLSPPTSTVRSTNRNKKTHTHLSTPLKKQSTLTSSRSRQNIRIQSRTKDPQLSEQVKKSKETSSQIVPTRTRRAISEKLKSRKGNSVLKDIQNNLQRPLRKRKCDIGSNVIPVAGIETQNSIKNAKLIKINDLEKAEKMHRMNVVSLSGRLENIEISPEINQSENQQTLGTQRENSRLKNSKVASRSQRNETSGVDFSQDQSSGTIAQNRKQSDIRTSQTRLNSRLQHSTVENIEIIICSDTDDQSSKTSHRSNSKQSKIRRKKKNSRRQDFETEDQSSGTIAQNRKTLKTRRALRTKPNSRFQTTAEENIEITLSQIDDDIEIEDQLLDSITPSVEPKRTTRANTRFESAPMIDLTTTEYSPIHLDPGNGRSVTKRTINQRSLRKTSACRKNRMQTSQPSLSEVIAAVDIDKNPSPLRATQSAETLENRNTSDSGKTQSAIQTVNDRKLRVVLKRLKGDIPEPSLINVDPLNNQNTVASNIVSFPQVRLKRLKHDHGKNQKVQTNPEITILSPVVYHQDSTASQQMQTSQPSLSEVIAAVDIDKNPSPLRATQSAETLENRNTSNSRRKQSTIETVNDRKLRVVLKRLKGDIPGPSLINVDPLNNQSTVASNIVSFPQVRLKRLKHDHGKNQKVQTNPEITIISPVYHQDSTASQNSTLSSQTHELSSFLQNKTTTTAATNRLSLNESIDRNDFINAITIHANDNPYKMKLMSLLNKPLRNQSRIQNLTSSLHNSKNLSLNNSQAASQESSLSFSFLGKTLHENEQYVIPDESFVKRPNIVLSPGKWRKSLNRWRKNNSILLDKTIDDTITNNSRPNQQQQLQTTSNSSFMLLSHLSTENSCNTVQDNLNTTSPANVISRFSRVKCKNPSFVSTLPSSILETIEIDCDQRRDSNVLLLEPTDDGTPNLPSLSLLESAIGRNLQSSLSTFHQHQQKSVVVVDSPEIDTAKSRRTTSNSTNNFIFNETSSNETRHPYQHQLSVPLFRQPSLPRRRRTSVIERCQDLITGHPVGDQLLFPEFVHIPYENSIRTQLSPREILLRRCNQSEPIDFSTVYSDVALQQCRKIGEGVYGEVFMNKTARGEIVVLKIVPIEGPIEVNGETQKSYDQILPEIVIAMELSRLRDDKQFMTRGFVEINKVCCVQGRYPEHLVDLWELYRDNSGTENDHPEIFSDDQLYIVFEQTYGGQDLEAFTFQNALQSYSAFVQTALTLAIAEQKYQFEHRDLHWGNILLAPTDDEHIAFRVNGEEIKIASHGVKVTIIDFTLSRMIHDGCCLYNDLSNDNELFSATGDYQFDIYRFMKQRLKNQWTQFEPYTNILWLHYTIDKMISGVRYRCSKSKKHRSAIHIMMQLRDDLLDYKSASDYVECLK